MPMYCGIDFGTSNSVVSVVGDGIADIESIREPSLIYFPERDETTVERYCGGEALRKYVEGGMRGRFFQSVKSVLPDPGFTGTRINGKKFTAEDLTAVMLRYLRTRMEERIGHPIVRAVFGRPARFSHVEAKDVLAQERLEKAAGQAGFENVRFELEPVAGAHAYDRLHKGNALVFVADHGGGTSDFTVMKLTYGEGSKTAEKAVLATHGVRVGGDDFDADIMWNRVVKRFGYGSNYESWGKRLPVPVHIYRTLCRWDRIHFLRTTAYREEFRYYRNGADDPESIERLITLVEENLSYPLAQAVEEAKCGLSDKDEVCVNFLRENIRISELISREEFERFVAGRIEEVKDAAGETLRRAGVTPADITAVFMTGGSSRVRALRACFADIFGANKILDDADRFESVSRGLAVAALELGLAL